MTYLIFQMFLYMLGAFLLGLMLGWIIWGRLRGKLAEAQATRAELEAEQGQLRSRLEACSDACADLERRLHKADPTATPDPEPIPDVEPVLPVAGLVDRPAASASPQARKRKKQDPVRKLEPAIADDLRRIIGIGPANEQKLKELGITTFAQIAAWADSDIRRVEDVLEFDGRIERERWIEQAQLLAYGDEEEFRRRFPTAGSPQNS